MKWIGASAEVVMSHPVEAVWEFVSNIENFGRWVDAVQEPRWTSEGERGVGSTYESEYLWSGKTSHVAYEVTAFEPMEKFASRTTEGRYPYQGAITIEAVEGGTKVTHDMMAGSDGAITAFMFTVLAGLLRPMMRKRLVAELEVMDAEIGKDVATA